MFGNWINCWRRSNHPAVDPTVCARIIAGILDKKFKYAREDISSIIFSSAPRSIGDAEGMGPIKPLVEGATK
jgi:hypothetical protein